MSKSKELKELDQLLRLKFAHFETAIATFKEWVKEDENAKKEHDIKGILEKFSTMNQVLDSCISTIDKAYLNQMCGHPNSDECQEPNVSGDTP